eukprot:g75881.t1
MLCVDRPNIVFQMLSRCFAFLVVLCWRWQVCLALIDIDIGALIPQGGNWDARGILTAVGAALADIRANESLLQGYQLVFWINDTQCDSRVGLQALLYQLTNPPIKRALYGAGCSSVSAPVAQVSSFFNLAQLSYASSFTSLGNRKLYPNFFRTIPSDWLFADVWLQLCLRYNWTRVATVHEQSDVFEISINRFHELLAGHNIQLITSEVVRADESSQFQVRNLKAQQARVVFMYMYEQPAMEVMCQAFLQNFLVDVAWIGEGWWNELAWDFNATGTQIISNCSTAQMKQAIDGMLLTESVALGPDTHKIPNQKEYPSQLLERLRTESPYSFATSFLWAYDAVYVLAYAFEHYLQTDRLDFLNYANQSSLERLKASISQVSFFGASGHVSFINGTGDRDGRVMLENWNNGVQQVVGYMDTDLVITNRIHWSSGKEGDQYAPSAFPKDLSQAYVQPAWSFPLFLSLVLLVLFLCFIAFLFTMQYRKYKLLRTTPLAFYLLLLLGASSLCVWLSFYLLQASQLVCIVRVYLPAVSGVLCVATIHAQARHWYAKRPRPPKQPGRERWSSRLVVRSCFTPLHSQSAALCSFVGKLVLLQALGAAFAAAFAASSRLERSVWMQTGTSYPLYSVSCRSPTAYTAASIIYILLLACSALLVLLFIVVSKSREGQASELAGGARPLHFSESSLCWHFRALLAKRLVIFLVLLLLLLGILVASGLQELPVPVWHGLAITIGATMVLTLLGLVWLPHAKQLLCARPEEASSVMGNNLWLQVQRGGSLADLEIDVARSVMKVSVKTPITSPSGLGGDTGKAPMSTQLQTLPAESVNWCNQAKDGSTVLMQAVKRAGTGVRLRDTLVRQITSLSPSSPSSPSAFDFESSEGNQNISHTKVKVVKYLLENRARVNACDEKGNTALHHAVRFGNVSLLSVLLAVPDLNPFLHNHKHQTALDEARRFHRSLAAQLIQDKMSSLRNSFPVLCAVIEKKNITDVRGLIRACADVGTHVGNFYPLLEACRQGPPSSLIARELIGAGAAVDVFDEEGNTPLLHACSHNQVELVQQLARAGADLEVRNMYGKGTKEILQPLGEAGGRIQSLLEDYRSIPKVLHTDVKFLKLLGQGDFGSVFSALYLGVRQAVKVPKHQREQYSMYTPQKPADQMGSSGEEQALNALQDQAYCTYQSSKEGGSAYADIDGKSAYGDAQYGSPFDTGRKLSKGEGEQFPATPSSPSSLPSHASPREKKVSPAEEGAEASSRGLTTYHHFSNAELEAMDEERKAAASSRAYGLFLHEALISTKIGSKPHVVPFRGADLSRASTMLVYELMPGNSLESFLERENPCLAELARLLAEASTGLWALHTSRVIHRDVAARNFLVDSHRACFICDFGLSEELPEEKESCVCVGGPWKWMAPEAMAPTFAFSRASDVYMFGIFMWWCRMQQIPLLKTQRVQGLQICVVQMLCVLIVESACNIESY